MSSVPTILRRLLGLAPFLIAISGWSPNALAQHAGGVNELKGEATYSIPIITPPGTNDTGPSLSLEYASGDGKGPAGWVGFGWSIGGLSAIERNTKRGVPFDYEGGTTCNGTFCYLDDFVLDGQDLVCNELSCSSDRYRTRIDDGTLIEYKGVDGWEIQDRDGTRYLYGKSPDGGTRIVNDRNNEVFSWLLERIEDVHGNWIEYSYDKPTGKGVALPSTIEYAQDEAEGNRSVSFIADPNTRNDRVLTYIAGFRQEIDQRIETIEVKAGTQLITSYGLSYESSPDSGRSLLWKVQRTGSDGTSTLEPHVFTYSAREVSQKEEGPFCHEDWSGSVVNGFEEEFTDFGSGLPVMGEDSSGKVRYAAVDLNRDGLTDLLRTEPSSYSCANRIDMLPGDGESFGQAVTWSKQLEGGCANHYAFSKKESWTASDRHHFYQEKGVIDLDGDGSSDVFSVQWGPSLFGSEQGFFGDDLLFPDGGIEDLSIDIGLGAIIASGWHVARGLDDNGGTVYLSLIDLNGDGRPDEVASQYGEGSYEGYPPSTSGWLVAFNEGRAPTSPQMVFSDSLIHWNDPMAKPIAVTGFGVHTVDVNGDGLPDRLDSGCTYDGDWTCTSNVSYNNGTGFDDEELFFENVVEGGYLSADYPLKYVDGWRTYSDFFDINGDGFPDQVMVGDPDTGPWGPPPYFWRVRFGTGSGLRPVTVWGGAMDPVWIGGNPYPLDCTTYEAYWDHVRNALPNAPHRGLADFNGDGLPDVYWKYDDKIRLNAGPTIDLLVSARQPLGSTMTFEYDYSTRMRDDAQEPANPGLGMPMPVVVKTTVYDGRVGTAEIVTSYHYSLGVYDYELKEFRAFGQVVRTEKGILTDPSDELIVTSNYSTDGSCPRLLLERELAGDETVFSRGIWRFDTADLPLGATEAIDQWHYCLLEYEISEAVEGDEQDLRCTQVEYDYGTDPVSDHYNVALIKDWGEVERSGQPPSYDYVDPSGGPTDNRFLFFEYAQPQSSTSHVVSRVKRRTVQNWGTSQPLPDHGSLDVRYYYDNLTLGVVDGGRRTKTERWQTYPIGDLEGQPRDPEWIAAGVVTYDGFGNVQTVTGPATLDDPNGYQTKTVYDSTYQTFPIERIAGSDLGTAEGRLTTELGYSNCWLDHQPPPALGLVCTTTEPYEQNGLTTTFGYDALGRVVEIERPNGLLETRGYDLAEPNDPAESLLTTTKPLASAPDLVYETWLDGLGRTFKTLSPGKEDETVQVLRTYDERGRLKTETIPHFDDEVTPLEQTLTYDALGRTHSILGYDGDTRTVWTYDVWKTTEEVYFGDPNQPSNRESRVERSVDAHGNLEKVVNYEGKATLGTPFLVTAEYDRLQRLTRVSDPIENDSSLCTTYSMGSACDGQEHQTEVTYDGLGRRAQIVDPDSGTWKFYYNEAGLLKKRVDGAGRIQEFTYDHLQRKLERSFSPSGSGAYDATFVYQNDPMQPDFGRLIEVNSSGTGSTSYEYQYDAAGRLWKRKQKAELAFETHLFTDTFEYDELGRLDTRTYPDGDAFTNIYNGTRLVGITGGDFDILLGAEYDALGRTKRLEVGDTNPDPQPNMPSTAVITRDYDSTTARLVSMDVEGWNEPNAPNLDLDVEFDGLSRLETQSASYSGTALVARSFEYDGLGRIETATGPWEQLQGNPNAVTWTYTYDPLGNLRSQTVSDRVAASLMRQRARGMLDPGGSTHATPQTINESY